MRNASRLFAALVLTGFVGSAQAQDCTVATAPACGGACLDGSICVEATSGVPCECVAGAPLDVTKLNIKLNFATADKDKIILMGTLPLLDDYVFDGKIVDIDVGGVVRSFTLDVKGKGETIDGDKISVKAPKDGVSKYAVKIAKGSFAASLADDGLSDATVSEAEVAVPVEVTLESARKKKLQTLSYTAKQGKSGSAKVPR